jgi:hypothetical protein
MRTGWNGRERCRNREYRNGSMEIDIGRRRGWYLDEPTGLLKCSLYPLDTA